MVNRPALTVASPPPRPLMLYDGDCRFCTLWIQRLRHRTGEFVDYVPSQSPDGAARFPEIPRDDFDHAVQLILPDGRVFHAAEAVCRALASQPEGQWLLELYQGSTLFALLADAAYKFVARHRKWFSLLTRWLWGGNVEAPEYGWVRWFFLRALGLLFLAAFLSLWPQLLDVAGGEGKQPVAKTISAAQAQFNAANIGADRYRQLPTLCWFNTSDAFLRLQCAAGTALAGLLVIGIAPAPCLVLLWLIYLSLTTACGNPYSFRWEDLLLETGFLAVFLAPLQLRPSHPLNEARPSRIALWLLRWLLFRLMIGSDILRLPADAGIPHWISTGLGFGFSYLLPLFIFLPRRPRHLAGLAFVVAQLVRLPASEHPLANALAIALCLTLLDDAAITRWLPGKLKRASAVKKTPQRRWPIFAELAVTGLVICASYTQSFQLVGIYMPGPEPIVQLNGWLRPFHTFNPYRQSP